MPSTNHLSYSKNGLSLTQSFEGVRLTAYQDQVGVWTIGYGHTGSDVHTGLTITQDQANDLLMGDVSHAAAEGNRLVTVSLTQDQFDALVDFVFDVGIGNFASSTLLRELNASNFTEAAAQFERWSHAGGVVVTGLLRRRQAEAKLFQNDVPTAEEA